MQIDRADKKQLPIAQMVAIGMLAWALVPSNPYGYYILLRWVICGVSAFLAFEAARSDKRGWAWGLAIGALVYNPFIPIHLNREIWSVVNVATIVLIGSTIRVLGRGSRSE